MKPEERVVGIFVGGRSRRMGKSKGRILAPDGSGLTLVERLEREVLTALPGTRYCLVGARPEYDSQKIEKIADLVPDQGPLGGLEALLTHAREHGASHALVIACDFPFVEAPLIRRLALESPEAKILCPYLDERYQGLFARYSVELLEPCAEALAAGRRALQPLLREHNAMHLQLSEPERASLVDWDKPEDVAGRAGAPQASEPSS